MKFDFYNVKQELIKIASKLFSTTEINIKNDIDLKDFFDCIDDDDIHGIMSLSPKEQMEKENLEYNKNEQGRDFFNSFLTLVIQSGVKLGHLQKEKEILDLKDKLKRNFRR